MSESNKMMPYVFQRHMAELSTAEFVSTSGRKVLVCEALSCNGSVNARPEKEKKKQTVSVFLNVTPRLTSCSTKSRFLQS